MSSKMKSMKSTSNGSRIGQSRITRILLGVVLTLVLLYWWSGDFTTKHVGRPMTEDSDQDSFDPFGDFEKITKFNEHDGSIELDIPGLSSKQNPAEGAANEAERMLKVVGPSSDGKQTPMLADQSAARLTKIEKSRFVRVQGFKYCSMLNNATFDSLAHVKPWGTTIARRDPFLDEFVQLLESEAQKLSSTLYNKYPSTLNSKDVMRFTCYTVADGSNHMVNLTDTQLIREIDSHRYISPIIPAISPSPSRIPGPRRKYKLAFLLMVHGKVATLESIINILNVIDDGSAVVLIHVDQKANELYEEVKKHVAAREKKMNEKLRPKADPEPGNIFMAQTRFHGYWGHVSLVWMQLSGFWELLDLADWDHVINLSAADYPLRYSRDMHRILNSPEYRGRDFVERWEDNSESATRITRPHLPRLGATKDGISLFHPREAGVIFPPFPRWKICKHHQWMILSPKFVRHLRTSDDALMALAFIEHTWIPDETYFCFVLINTPEYGHNSVNGNKRFLKFNLGSIHPMTLDITSTSLIGQDGLGQEPQYLLVRKVEPRTAKGRQLLAWIHREHIQKHADRVGPNGTLLEKPEVFEGSKWVDLEGNAQMIKEFLAKADTDGGISPVVAVQADPVAGAAGQAVPLPEPEKQNDRTPARPAVPAGAIRNGNAPGEAAGKAEEILAAVGPKNAGAPAGPVPKKDAEVVDEAVPELAGGGEGERQRQMEQDRIQAQDQRANKVDVEAVEGP
ncbi:hypothetical protein HDU97_000918 [Phlyctochytrium planicorne]|nr:hypothetical protein HDU97_000918 [Phlyctochytrium planicorne]